MESGHNTMEQTLLRSKYLLGHSQFSTNCEPALPLDIRWSSSWSHSTKALIFKNIQSKKSYIEWLNQKYDIPDTQHRQQLFTINAEIVTYFGSLRDILNTGVTKQDWLTLMCMSMHVCSYKQVQSQPFISANTLHLLMTNSSSSFSESSPFHFIFLLLPPHPFILVMLFFPPNSPLHTKTNLLCWVQPLWSKCVPLRGHLEA